jgi:hypothetical protein
VSDPFERLRSIPKGSKREAQLESSVKEGVLALLRSRWPKGVWFKVHQGGLTHSGGADVQGCLPVARRGLYVAIELKSPKEYRKADHHLTGAQLYFGKQVLRAGGIWGCACSAEQAARIIERGLSREGRREMWAQYYQAYAVQQFRRSMAARKRRVTPITKRLKRRLEIIRKHHARGMPLDRWGMLIREKLDPGG